MMCTLTWLKQARGYEVFFNRDEQHEREKALPPRYYEAFDCIMPKDPQGQGTWIAVNRNGLTLALLNRYPQQGLVMEAPISRGLVIPALVRARTLREIQSGLMSIVDPSVPPFLLFAIAQPDAPTAAAWTWDGKTLASADAQSPLVSSSVELGHTHHDRQSLYQLMNLDEGSSADHLIYHQSHFPTQGATSVCLHRQDAKTVSLSHIAVRDNEIDFAYLTGSPCEHGAWHVLNMPCKGLA